MIIKTLIIFAIIGVNVLSFSTLSKSRFRNIEIRKLKNFHSSHLSIHLLNHQRQYNKDEKILFLKNDNKLTAENIRRTRYSVDKEIKINPYITVVKLIIKKSFKLIAGIIFMIKQFFLNKVISKLNKSKSKIDNNINQETIDSVIAMAENEKINEEVVDANVISVTVADKKTILNEIPTIITINNPIKEKDLEAAKKTVELKLKEIEQREMSTLKPIIMTDSSDILNININNNNNNNIAEDTTTDKNNNIPIETHIKIIESFPDVVSEKITDHTYMTQDYGPVDPYASVDESLLFSNNNNNNNKSESWKKIKSAGVSGIVAYVLTELSFWILFPVCIYTYQSINHQNIDLGNSNDVTTIFSLSAGFITLARLAVPARIALALSLIPFVEENITKKYSLAGKEINSISSTTTTSSDATTKND